MDAKTPIETRRKDARHRTLKGAKIIFNADNSVIDATIRDISNKGARLRVDGAISLPAEFKLLVHDETVRRSAFIRWRHGHEAGIEFGESGR